MEVYYLSPKVSYLNSLLREQEVADLLVQTVFTDRVVYQEMASKGALFWIDFNLLTGSGTYTGM